MRSVIEFQVLLKKLCLLNSDWVSDFSLTSAVVVGGASASKGILQFDMWNVTPSSGNWDWDKLKIQIKKDGIRNSLMLAPMPTASTSQILGNNECIEPYTSNIYTRRVLSGEFTVVNKHLLNHKAIKPFIN